MDNIEKCVPGCGNSAAEGGGGPCALQNPAAAADSGRPFCFLRSHRRFGPVAGSRVQLPMAPDFTLGVEQEFAVINPVYNMKTARLGLVKEKRAGGHGL
jgi:hypothetical protein